jgi:hypothetical protein
MESRGSVTRTTYVKRCMQQGIRTKLVMAAQFRAAGFRPQFLEPADAIITIDSIQCSVECKRIQTENGLKECVQKASSQIKKRLSQETSAKLRALIAIDISKTVNTDGTLYFSATSSDHLSRQVDSNLEAFLKRNRTKLTSHLHSRVSAVLLYLRTRAVIEDQGGVLANFRRLFVVPSAWNDGKNKSIYQKLVNQLCRKAPKQIFERAEPLGIQ